MLSNLQHSVFYRSQKQFVGQVFDIFQPVVLMLVGNKTDLEHRRVVRIERHTKFALQYGMSSYYVSAKTGDSVMLMFR